MILFKKRFIGNAVADGSFFSFVPLRRNLVKMQKNLLKSENKYGNMSKKYIIKG